MTLWAALVLVPVVLTLAILCVARPLRVGLPLYAALIPFGGALSIGPSRYGSASSLIGLALGVGLVLQLVSGRPAARRVPLTVSVWLLFLGLALVTSVWTLDRPTTWSGLGVLGSLVLVFVLASVSDVDRTVVRRTENGLVLGGVAAVGFGLVQLLLLGGFPADVTDAVGTEGRFGNGLLGPNIESITLLLPLAITLHRACTEHGARHRALNVVTALLLLFGILMTGSRTGTIGVALVVLALVFVTPGRARLALLGALVVGAALATVVWVYHPLGLAERTFASATSSSGRVDIWRVGFAACGQYCLAGSGWGTFPDVYAATQALVPQAHVLSGPQGSYQPHNLWLLTLIETGILGTILLTVGLLLAFRDALRLPADFRGPAFAGLVGLTFGVVFLSSMEFKIFWMVLLLINLYRNSSAVDTGPARASDVEDGVLAGARPDGGP
jgi:hypothetical protein